ncbi:MAG TPA: hypothetical protein VIM12_10985 [Noviherbaspirillum sp.]|uniref:hypothetical protein n=1 Tax=Noviherbaspirillum sp. TaxID=1926288 RepID=UPI002F95344C
MKTGKFAELLPLLKHNPLARFLLQARETQCNCRVSVSCLIAATCCIAAWLLPEGPAAVLPVRISLKQQIGVLCVMVVKLTQRTQKRERCGKHAGLR